MAETHEPGSNPAADEQPYSRDDLIGALGLDPAHAARLWGAFGFPQGPDSSRVFSAEDLETLRVFIANAQAIDPTAQLAGARALGQATARLAEWEAEQIRAMATDPDSQLSEEQLIAAVSRLQQLVWRRHLDLQFERHRQLDRQRDGADPQNTDDLGEDMIVGFADIVGYTSLSRRLRLDELEDLLEAFESAAQQIINTRGGRVVKNIGDAVMFTAVDAEAAAAIALDLHALASDGTLPTLRIGLARGPVLARMGDLFGEPVNIAARLASTARAGTTLVDEHLTEELRGRDELRVAHIPPQSVRGYRRLKAAVIGPARRTDRESKPKY